VTHNRCVSFSKLWKWEVQNLQNMPSLYLVSINVKISELHYHLYFTSECMTQIKPYCLLKYFFIDSSIWMMCYDWFVSVLLLAISHEGDCRRKILKGRKAITRTYYRYTAVPAWAIVLLVGLGQIIFGAILFVILKFLVVDQAIKPRYIQALTSPRMSP
jgi:hypothetical protein